MRRCLTILILLFAVALPTRVMAQSKLDSPDLATSISGTAPQGSQNANTTLTLNIPGSKSAKLGSAIEIVLLMTALSLAPAIIMTMTCFTRIIIVLSFLKRAMSMQDLPPAMVVSGFAVFMSIFIMKPVISDLYEQAYKPYIEDDKFTITMAADVASRRMSKFMLRQTRSADLELIHKMSGSKKKVKAPEDLPFHIVVPAFILSEIKTAFQMGFVLFLPFVIIDLVIASILVSMGMFTLPPIVVSTPLKLLLFIMVDGWNLVVVSLTQSFMVSS